MDENGNPQLTASNLSHRYLWQPQAVDQLMADEQLLAASGGGYDQSQPGNVVWPLADQLGTIRDLTTNDAQTGVTSVANHRSYDTYGNLKSQTNAAVDCLFGFAGLAFDRASETYRSATRRYAPLAGRWLEKDWIAFNGGDTNTSRYCGDSPTNATDPSGTASISDGTYPDIEVFRGEGAIIESYWRMKELSPKYAKRGLILRVEKRVTNYVFWEDVRYVIVATRDGLLEIEKPFSTQLHHMWIQAEFNASLVMPLNISGAAGKFSQVGASVLRKLGLKDVELAGASYNAARKSLEEAGFVLKETTSTGRRVFVNAETGVIVTYDSGRALAEGQQVHWTIQDKAGRYFRRSGRLVDGPSPPMGGKHIREDDRETRHEGICLIQVKHSPSWNTLFLTQGIGNGG